MAGDEGYLVVWGREAFAGCVRLLTWGGWPRMVGSEWLRLVYS